MVFIIILRQILGFYSLSEQHCGMSLLQNACIRQHIGNRPIHIGCTMVQPYNLEVLQLPPAGAGGAHVYDWKRLLRKSCNIGEYLLFLCES